MTSNPSDPDFIDPRLYADCVDYKKVGDKFKFLLTEYNDTDGMKEMNLVLF